MTVHSAKGLEFDAVFITGIEEGLFPHENALSDADGVEEERRLMYVAITRARQRLYLSFSQTRMLHGQTRYNVKSRFFDELPDAALKWLTPRRQGFGSGFAQEYQQAWAARQRAVGHRRRRTCRTAAGGDARGARNPAACRSASRCSTTSSARACVLTLEGAGADARAQVNFGRHGMKWLALSVAKLTPIE